MNQLVQQRALNGDITYVGIFPLQSAQVIAIVRF